jgi:hypothetical protein
MTTERERSAGRRARSGFGLALLESRCSRDGQQRPRTALCLSPACVHGHGRASSDVRRLGLPLSCCRLESLEAHLLFGAVNQLTRVESWATVRTVGRTTGLLAQRPFSNGNGSSNLGERIDRFTRSAGNILYGGDPCQPFAWQPNPGRRGVETGAEFALHDSSRSCIEQHRPL